MFSRMHTPAAPLGAPAVQILRKIPHVTAVFWVMKICATTLGETGGDLLSKTMHVGYGVASLVFLSFFLITLLLQLMATRYHPPLFWAVIVTTSTAGTTMSDYMDRTLGLGYALGSLILVAILLLILGLWRVTEKTLSVDDVTTRRREIFYWSAILFSNTLGTALGDYLADDTGLGFAGGALLIGSALALVLVATYFTKLSRVLLFWIAFVLTRPFGATMGDVLIRPPEEGGLDLGTLGASVALLGVLVILVLREVALLHRARSTVPPTA